MDISVRALILYRLLKAEFLSFSNRKKKFRTPITASECDKFNKSLVSGASRRKWAWILKVFEERNKQRNEAALKEHYGSESIIQEDIADDMSDEMLDFTLARFVAKVTKEDAQEYPGKKKLLALIPLALLFPINKLMNIILLNTINCAPYYQSP